LDLNAFGCHHEWNVILSGHVCTSVLKCNTLWIFLPRFKRKTQQEKCYLTVVCDRWCEVPVILSQNALNIFKYKVLCESSSGMSN